jgi:dTMP kinase
MDAGAKRGKFISFEGLDGAGKSTHIEATCHLLRARQLTVVSTREPGGTPLGERLRQLLLTESMHLETETLLMFAARREHVAEVIVPALCRGDWVVSDRFTDASFAYQGGGRGLAEEKIEQLAQWTHGGLQPDLTLLFDLPYEVARARIDTTRDLDRFEQEKGHFHERVREVYRRRATAEPGRIRMIDATLSVDEIMKKVEKYVVTIC